MSIIKSHKNAAISGLIILFLFGFALSVDAATLTWDGGGTNNLASNRVNWSGNVIPQNGDNVIFDGTSIKNCTWDLEITLASLTKKSGYTGKITKISGVSLTIAKIKRWTGGGTNNFASNPANWYGNTAPQNGYKVVFDNTSSKNCTWDIDVAPVSFNLYSGYSGTVTLNSALTITGNLSVESGILNLNNKNLNVDGYILIATSGTLNATSSTITVKSDWTNWGGFNYGTSTVVLSGANQTVSGNATFYNLTKTVTSADTLYFQAGSTQTVINNLTLTGASGGLLSLMSTSSGSYWYIDPRGTGNVSFANISDLYNLSFTNLIAINSTDSGHNTNVSFGGSECVCLTPPHSSPYLRGGQVGLRWVKGVSPLWQREERGDFKEVIIGQVSSLTEVFNGQLTDNDWRPPC